MNILQSRGYFHPQGPEPPPPPPSSSTWDDDCDNKNSDSRNTHNSNGKKEEEEEERGDENHDTSCVIETKTGDYATIEYLQGKFMNFIQTTTNGGKCTLAAAASDLGLEIPTLTKRILNDTKFKERYPDVIQVHDRVFTEHHLDEMVKEVQSDMERGGGYCTVSSLAKTNHWTNEQCRRFLTHRLARVGINERRNDMGMIVFVTKAFQNRLESSVASILSKSHDVVNITQLCQEHKWEVSWVSDIVHTKIHELSGSIRGDDFIPDAYRHKQEQTVIDYFTTNGYVTTGICPSVDLSPNQLKSLLQKKNPRCIVLRDCIIDYAAVGVPLEALVQEATESFTEMRPPADLLNFPSDMQTFVEEYVFSNCPSVHGVLTVTADRILFISTVVWNDINENLIPHLVDPIVKERAIRWDEVKQAGGTGNRNDGAHDDDTENYNLIPTSSVIGELMDRFPALQVLSHDEDDNILERFVEAHVLNDAFRETCRNRIAAEASRIEATREKQTGLIAHTSTAEVAFEDASCFAAACHVIQMQYKFLEYAEKVGMTVTDRTILEQEILHGCCRDFVRRLTLYLLDKYEVVDSEITFEIEGKTSVSSSYCTPVDTALRKYPKLIAKCKLDKGGKERELAEALTDTVPIQAGKALGELDKASTVKDFLISAEENCLTICGIPFRKLDKKSEKNFLAHRRQCLISLLQAADDPCDVLEYTVMLLYQHTKNQVVFGSLLKGPILEKLVQERKISAPVGDTLQSLAKSLDSCSNDLVESVRACGLAKDIAKHTLS